MRRFIAPLCLLFVLTACATTETRIKDAIKEGNYCESVADCVLVGSKCPFDCYIYANAKEADRIRTLVDGYDSSCEYSCIATEGVGCSDHVCVPLLPDDPSDNAGNAGAVCETHEDCVTPMDYLVRSSCPFTSYCVDGTCAVACPMMNPDPVARPADSWRVVCSEDADCDCSRYAGSDADACRCIDGMCAALVR